MRKIPLFSVDEIQELIPKFADSGISIEIEAVSMGPTSQIATSLYYILVPEEDFVDCLISIMPHFAIEPVSNEGHHGECPACFAEVNGALECPDCGLSFAGGPSESTRAHPFYQFLETNNLLPF